VTPTATLYVVRHGETDWNVEARLQGQRDIPLNGVGRVQAEEAGRRLASVAPDPAALAYVASPLGRARETMERLRRSLGLDPCAYRTDPLLAEISFGAWEGLTWKEVRGLDAPAAAARTREKWSYVPPGGESYAMLAARVAPFAAGLDRDTVAVTHGGVARVLLASLCGLAQTEAPSVDIWQGRVLVIAEGRYRWA
jgi:broad specificity phosphatase PhoE